MLKIKVKWQAGVNTTSLLLIAKTFDSRATCIIYKGTLQKDGMHVQVTCKQFRVRMTSKFRRRLEKEAITYFG